MVDRGEDKLIAQARREGKTSEQIAQFYTEAFHQDEAALHIQPAHFFPRATQHIPEMIQIVRGLLAKEIAYEVDGYVYYDIKRFSEYGKLSGNLLENMLAGVREGVDTQRHNPEDFPLWKPAEPGREMAWDSPWGRGFPGWHIECSAMSMKYLGEHFDLHTGGVDNIFPHHEDEIAQSEGYTGQPYVNYWVHAQHLLADGQKMAKSTGNAYTRAEIEARGFDPMALRYFYTTALYRSRLNFTFRALQSAQTALERLRDLAYQRFTQADRERALVPMSPAENPWQEAFLCEVEQDLNMPRAMAVVWEMLHSKELDATMAVRLLLDFDRILGFGLREYLQSEQPLQKYDPQAYLAQAPHDVVEQVQERAGLREQHSYAQADALREHVGAEGYALRDTSQGTLVLKRRPEDEFITLSSSADAPDHTRAADQFEFSVNLLAHNSRDDLDRCIQSIRRHAGTHTIELVIIDNGSTDETLAYLEELARHGELITDAGQALGLQVLFADHNLGFAAGRNATMRASRGKYLVLMDSSIEVTGDIWEPLAQSLQDESLGVVGPYGLVTEDLREFQEAQGSDVDAVEGYLMAFRRALLPEIGWIDEKFRFYRLMDIYLSFFFKTAGYRAVTTPAVAARVTKHPHREWYSLSEDEQATKSKKNYDIFRDRWHHGQSLLVTNYRPDQHWPGHDHAQHLEGTHTHTAEELPAPGVMHTHVHRHWPDHSHEHPHYHNSKR
jgi:cysteinyl-tRNA synthetase